jgi:hypothetical protein
LAGGVDGAFFAARVALAFAADSALVAAETLRGLSGV